MAPIRMRCTRPLVAQSDRARAGQGPTLLECVAHRLQGHSYGSDEAHMDAERLATARANAPLSNSSAPA